MFYIHHQEGNIEGQYVEGAWRWKVSYRWNFYLGKDPFSQADRLRSVSREGKKSSVNSGTFFGDLWAHCAHRWLEVSEVLRL